MPSGEEDAARQALQRAAEISGLPLQRRGFVPSPSQKDEIQAIVHDLGTNIQAVDAEISRLRELRTDMVKQRAASQSIMSPIRALPRELLSEIFNIVGCDTGNLHYPLGNHIYFLDYPPFASVCLEWWLTALGTPALWTDFHINGAPRVHKQPTLLSQFLARSASLPLQVYLHSVEEGARAAFSLLAQLSQRRWGSLTLYAYTRFQPLDCPMLATVSVAKEVRSDDLDLTFLTKTAGVRHLSLSLDHLAVTLPPWSGISTLNLTVKNADDHEFSLANRLISSFRQTLENLVVVDNGGDPIDTANSNRGEPCTLPALASIDLDHYTYAMMRTIIAHNLRGVTLRWCPTHDEFGAYVLADSGLMAMRSARSLTIISFGIALLDRLLEVLDGLPSLERIVVDDISCRDGILSRNKFVSALADLGGNGRPVRLPNLTSLALRLELYAEKAADRERRQVLAGLMRVRGADCVVDGVMVKGLKELTTNLPHI